MNLKSGFPFWLIKDGLPFQYPALTCDTTAAVVVMGAGISGALVAWELVNRGVDCLVVDARSVGLGSTCASTSLLQYEIDIPLHQLQQQIGEKQANRAYALCAQSISDLAEIAGATGFKNFQHRQSLYYAAYKKDRAMLQQEYKSRKAQGYEVVWLEPAEIKQLYGFDSSGAILSKAAATTDAYGFTHALLQAGMTKGLRVFDRTAITSIQHGVKKVQLVTETGHHIVAKKLVYATGYEATRYISEPIVQLHSTYACAGDCLQGPAWYKDSLIWNTAVPYLYLRTTRDNRIVIGGRDENFYSPAKRDRLLGRKTKQLAKDFERLFPLVPFTPEFSWAGTFGTTKDGLPFIGTYKPLPGSYFALGFGGNGITFSRVAAVITANLVTGKADRDASLFSFDRL